MTEEQIKHEALRQDLMILLNTMQSEYLETFNNNASIHFEDPIAKALSEPSKKLWDLMNKYGIVASALTQTGEQQITATDYSEGMKYQDWDCSITYNCGDVVWADQLLFSLTKGDESVAECPPESDKWELVKRKVKK